MDKLSGAPIEGFSQGWAIIPFNRKPHFYPQQAPVSVDISNRLQVQVGRRITGKRYRARCGLVTWVTSGCVPLAEGDFKAERCKSCERLINFDKQESTANG